MEKIKSVITTKEEFIGVLRDSLFNSDEDSLIKLYTKDYGERLRQVNGVFNPFLTFS